MITLQSITKQYGQKKLFADFSLQINPGSRIALVGLNGTGKSTLLKIIVGEIEADSGLVNRSRYTSVGYLPQDGIYHGGKSLFDEAARAFEGIIRLEQRMAHLSREIEREMYSAGSGSQQVKILLEELGELQHILEHREGYKTETKIKQILFGLGFTESDLPRMTDEFSGGWQMRIELAKLLLSEPTVLLLDEPTNHLDMESLQWLESYLTRYHGSIILVSHDSRFLDTLVQEVVEISRGKATLYAGNYSAYLAQKAERQRIVEASYVNQQKLIARTTRFVERFRYKNTKARQVQSRVKLLDKLDTIDLEGKEKDLRFSFPDPPRAGRVLMELKDISKSYGTSVVLNDISLSIERNDRIACLGVNGSGKSTLARIIAGIEDFQRGVRSEGHNVSISYYGQDMTEKLNPNETVLHTLDRQAPMKSSSELRSLLGCFLFTEDDVFKPVSVLSGGEKSRLALACMLLQPANLLILDEPTNHLDIRSKAVLQERLSDFSGTYFIVSHDRDFLAPLIQKVAVIKEGRLEIHQGSVDDYLEKYRDTQEYNDDSSAATAKISASIQEKDRKRREAALRQEKHRKIKPLKEAREKIEKEITAHEKRKGDIESAFSRQETFADDGLIRSLHMEFSEIQRRLEVLYEEWAALEESIDNLEKEHSIAMETISGCD